MDKVSVKNLIVCTKARRGSGKKEVSPIRAITEVFSLNGDLIAEDDPYGGITPESVLEFLNWHYSSIPEKTHIEKVSAYFIESDIE